METLNPKSLIILGIDPGTTAIGYAILEVENKPRLSDCGLIKITSDNNPGLLLDLYLELKKLIAYWQPGRVAVERLFFAKNVKTASAVSEARGVILLTTALAGLSAYEYTPLEVKKAVTGDGGADKRQLEKMVRLTLPETKNLEAADDVFDAIGVALTCCFKEKKTF